MKLSPQQHNARAREHLKATLLELVSIGALEVEYDRDGVQRYRNVLPERFFREEERAVAAKAAKA